VTAINALRYFVLGVGGFGDRDVDEERESVVRFVAHSCFLSLCFFIRMFECLWIML
jgi:hypothetical protein